MTNVPRQRFALGAAAAVFATLMSIAPTARAKDASPVQRDSAGVTASDQLVASAADYCDREAPADGAKLRSAHAQWRRQHDVESVRQRVASTKPMAPDAARRLHERMGAQGQPAKACAQMIAMLGTADMNLRARFPAAYVASPSAGSSSTTTTTSPPTAAAAPAPTANTNARPVTPTASVAPGTLLLTPAQLSAIVQRTPYVKGRSQQQRLEAAGLAGDIAIKGRVVRSGDSLFIDHVEGPFRSRMRVSPGVNVKEYEGKDVVVAGRFDEWPSSLAFLRKSRLVDGSGLKPSAEPNAAGMMRAGVEADVIRTAPGKGVATGDVAGVLYHGRGATNAYGSYAFVEDATVLFRDGWAYHRLDVPPSDLNVKVSRDVEPQRWSKWRRAGSGFEIQRMDDHGRVKGEWRTAEGTLAGAWPAGTPLRGPYTSAAFHGSIALGGTYVKNTHTFGEDGRYEGSRFAQSGAGSMAANNGFNSMTTSQSDKTGSNVNVEFDGQRRHGEPDRTRRDGDVECEARRRRGAPRPLHHRRLHARNQT